MCLRMSNALDNIYIIDCTSNMRYPHVLAPLAPPVSKGSYLTQKYAFTERPFSKTPRERHSAHQLFVLFMV